MGTSARHRSDVRGQRGFGRRPRTIPTLGGAQICALLLGPILAGAVARAQPPAGALPALIPREALLANPDRVDPRLSPDGARLGYLAPSADGVQNLWVQTLGEGDTRMVTRDTHRGIGAWSWAEDARHLLYVQDRDGDENWHLWAVDLQTDTVRDLTPWEGVAVQELLTDADHPGEILVESNRRDPAVFDLWRIGLQTGEATMEAQNPGDVTEWLADADFRVRAAVALDQTNSDTVLRVRDVETSAWRDLMRWPFLQAGSVLYKKLVAFSPDGARLIVQSAMGADKSRLVELDVASGAVVRVLAADERSDISNHWWVPQVVRHPRTRAVQAVAFDYLLPRWEVLDSALAPDFAALAALAQREDGAVFDIISRDRLDRRWLVQLHSDIQPGSYFWYERSTRQATPLFESIPTLRAHVLARQQPSEFTARDGLTIPVYLTLPPGLPPRALPLVLLVHGGPWVRDSYGYDPWVQLLANRGYAVLQVNYRGSTGYGTAFLNAGNGQWAVGSMQHDLSDAVAWAIAQGIADPRRVAIVGGSYGGYATLCGLAFTPELYRCGVDIVGPSNVATLFASMPPYWQVRKLRWKLRVGDVEGDDALNRSISPLFHTDAIRAPLLIGHGANDPRVKLSESEAIATAVRAKGGEVAFVVYPDEGHGFVRPENNLDFFGRVEEFLATHLGGRAQPWVAVDGSSVQVK